MLQPVAKQESESTMPPYGTDYWFMTPVSNPDNTAQELPLSLAVMDVRSNCCSTTQLGARHHKSSVLDGLQRRLWHRVVVSSSESERCELLYMSEQRVVFCKFSGSMPGTSRVSGRSTLK
ncbi:hypothetical protein Taro_024118 [Colocasia esculenta]|uniref:Uncharacterized protein n=1 Tax=Colocasia esculenta TaxID=4460 RepID=A0A843VCS1_COLES|nr:hypothetical protein [Colocasia esculenta]